MNFNGGIALAASLVFASTLVAQAPSRPNVVLIVADDLGWADTDLYRDHELHETPNIDRLAARGMRFTNAYAAGPVCSPTRNSILTGLNPARTGMFKAVGGVPEVVLDSYLPETASERAPLRLPVSATRLNPRYATLAQSLKNAGYATGHFGKWHLGKDPIGIPLTSGFEVEFPGFHNATAPGGYFGWSDRPKLSQYAGMHVDDACAAEAVEFMRQNRKRPFFLNFWTFSVHAPYEAKPSLAATARRQAGEVGSSKSPTYAAMVGTLDQNVGRVLNAIDNLKLTNETIVIFASDNGGVVHETLAGVPVTSNAPLRSGKGTLWEGGIRVPFVVVWPGTVAANSVSEELVQSVDLYPTILEMVGIERPAEQVFDGISVVPALRGERLERDAIFTYFPSESAAVPDRTPPGVSVRWGDLKLIRYFHANADRSHAYDLYDLGKDPGETNDLAGAMPNAVATLDAKIEAFLAETQAVVPLPNEGYVAEASRRAGASRPRR